MFSSLLVCGDTTRSMLSSKVSHVDSKMGDREGATHRQAAMEQTVKKVTHEVVRRIAGFEHSFVVEPRFDRIYEMVILIYKKYRTQLERMVSSLTLCDVDTAAASFDRVLDSLFVGGHINCGRVVTVLAFAGCVAQRCLQDRVIASTADVDQLAEVMGRQLAARLVQCRYSLEEFERFATQSGVFEALPWRSIAFSIFGLGALALYFSIPH